MISKSRKYIIIGLGCISGILSVTLVCNGEQSMVEKKSKEVRNAVAVGMSRTDAEAALRHLHVEPQYLSRHSLEQLYGAEWKREHPDVQGRLCGRMSEIATHMIGTTDLSIEVDIGFDDKVTAVRTRPLQIAP